MGRLWWATIVLLAAGLAGPTGQAESPEKEAGWQVEDNAGDVTVAGQRSGLSPHLDIRRLAIENEDELGFDLVVTLAQLKVAPQVADADQYFLRVRMKPESAENVFEGGLALWGARAGPGSQEFVWSQSMYGWICYRSDRNCIAVSTVPDEAQQAFRLQFRKDQLEALMQPSRSGVAPTGSGPAVPPPREVYFRGGTQLTDISVALAPVQFNVWNPTTDPAEGDRAPDGPSPPFTFAYRTANQEIVVLLGNSYFYSPGEHQTVEFRVVNHAAAKRLIRVSYELSGPGADQYEVRGPTNLSIPGGQARQFTFDLRAPATDAPATLRIRADSLPLGEVGIEASALRSGLPLGPALKELRILRSDPSGYGPNPFCLTFECANLILSAPGAVAGYEASGQVAASPTQGHYGFRIYGRPNMAYPFTVEQGGVTEVKFRLASVGVERADRTVRAVLTYSTGYLSETLLDQSKEVTLTTTPTELVFRSPPRPKTMVLPGQGGWFLRVDVPYEGTFFMPVRDYVMELEGSSVRLPLGPLPEDYLVKPAPTPFRLRALGDREDFVNPGEARLFNVSVYNQDSVEQRARIDFRVPTAGWSGDVLPGREVTLAPGDSATLGVLVRAPADAADGQVGSLLLEVLADTGVSTQLNLTAIVVSTQDFADDDGRFSADEADLRKFGTPAPARTPGAAAGLGLALLGAAAWNLRKRNG